QTEVDAQPLFPGTQYKVAVEAGDASGYAAPIYSEVGSGSYVDRSQYNGFLDEMNLPEGSIDPSLWDYRGYIVGYGQSQGGTFINPQLHGHLQVGDIAVEQAFASMSARVPFDFTGRTGHIHGDVDLHANLSQWFAAVLAPRHIQGNEMFDH